MPNVFEMNSLKPVVLALMGNRLIFPMFRYTVHYTAQILEKLISVTHNTRCKYLSPTGFWESQFDEVVSRDSADDKIAG